MINGEGNVDMARESGSEVEVGQQTGGRRKEEDLEIESGGCGRLFLRVKLREVSRWKGSNLFPFYQDILKNGKQARNKFHSLFWMEFKTNPCSILRSSSLRNRITK